MMEVGLLVGGFEEGREEWREGMQGLKEGMGIGKCGHWKIGKRKGRCECKNTSTCLGNSGDGLDFTLNKKSLMAIFRKSL